MNCIDSVVIETPEEESYEDNLPTLDQLNKVTDKCKNCPSYYQLRRKLKRLLSIPAKVTPKVVDEDPEVVSYYQKISKRNS